MLQVLHVTNLGARFLIELCALAALSFWGFHLTAGTSLRTAVGILAPLSAAVVWGLLAAPKAAISLPAGAKLAVQLGVLGLAAVALLAAGKPQWAGVFAAAAAVNAALMTLWGQ